MLFSFYSGEATANETNLRATDQLAEFCLLFLTYLDTGCWWRWLTAMWVASCVFLRRHTERERAGWHD